MPSRPLKETIGASIHIDAVELDNGETGVIIKMVAGEETLQTIMTKADANKTSVALKYCASVCDCEGGLQ